MQLALRLDADRLPTPRADGDRDALRILLGARHDLTMASTAQTNRLRALLRDGDGDRADTDRDLARGALPEATLTAPARRRLPRDATRAQAVRHGEIRRLAIALRAAARALKANRAQLQAIVDELLGKPALRGAQCDCSAHVVPRLLGPHPPTSCRPRRKGATRRLDAAGEVAPERLRG